MAYGGLRALESVSLEIRRGEIVALVGANGAGKSSLLKAIARVESCRADEMSFAGESMKVLGPEDAVARGISLVPEGRHLFSSLSVADNLAVGRYSRRRRLGFCGLVWKSAAELREMEARLAEVYQLFPVLRERRDQLAGVLSGGQGQMLAIGRALMAAPTLLMLDEPSLGLAPQVVVEILRSLVHLRDAGVTILVVEQNARAALEIADRGYVLTTGRIVASGTGQELLAAPDISGAYLGWSPPRHAVAEDGEEPGPVISLAYRAQRRG